MGDISIVALVVIGLNVLVSWKGFNDLAFFEKNGKVTHVGIFVSKEKVIHASGTVKIEKIDIVGIISKSTGQYTHHLAEIRRL